MEPRNGLHSGLGQNPIRRWRPSEIRRWRAARGPSALRFHANGTASLAACPETASLACKAPVSRDRSATARDAYVACVRKAQSRFFRDVWFSFGKPAQPDIHILEGGKHTTLSVDMLALATELMLSPVSKQNSAPGGEGSPWFGVHTLQNRADSVQIADLIWKVRPHLIIEIGTECGGSALFMGQLLRMIGRGKMLTYDFNPVRLRQCQTPRGFDSPLWTALIKDGILESRVCHGQG